MQKPQLMMVHRRLRDCKLYLEQEGVVDEEAETEYDGLGIGPVDVTASKGAHMEAVKVLCHELEEPLRDVTGDEEPDEKIVDGDDVPASMDKPHVRMIHHRLRSFLEILDKRNFVSNVEVEDYYSLDVAATDEDASKSTHMEAVELLSDNIEEPINRAIESRDAKPLPHNPSSRGVRSQKSATPSTSMGHTSQLPGK